MENRTLLEKVLLETFDLKNTNENMYFWLFGDDEFGGDLGFVKNDYEKSDKSKSFEEFQLEFIISSMINSWNFQEFQSDKNQFEGEMYLMAKKLGFEKEFFEMLSGKFDYVKWRDF